MSKKDIAHGLSALFLLVLVLITSFLCLRSKSQAWFANNKQVNSTGMAFSVNNESFIQVDQTMYYVSDITSTSGNTSYTLVASPTNVSDQILPMYDTSGIVYNYYKNAVVLELAITLGENENSTLEFLINYSGIYVDPSYMATNNTNTSYLSNALKVAFVTSTEKLNVGSSLGVADSSFNHFFSNTSSLSNSTPPPEQISYTFIRIHNIAS